MSLLRGKGLLLSMGGFWLLVAVNPPPIKIVPGILQGIRRNTKSEKRVLKTVY